MMARTSAMLRFTQLDEEDFALPPEIVASCNGYHGKYLTLVTRHNKPVNVRLEKIGQSFYICKGWKKFVELTGLRVGQCIRFSVSSPSTLDLLVLDKHGVPKLPMPASSEEHLRFKAKRSIHQNSKGHSSSHGPESSSPINHRINKSGQLTIHVFTFNYAPLLILTKFRFVRIT
ncbi:B3 domain-containing protein Os10g0323000-like [Oryza glaberrima]|uniref:B3 domain-containing protein Os10g0323000-like n=1 Tax=Oryza glaberrima TaxID=4538 RepID=UPI00224C546E|nr:B3 domain-containing protein Os10g0323000-like [Oryza glaberrima]XP_052139860.1 B3 domain-containing protein Os10g0323000-like [Oryza glaberrima]XP_052139861.1 B3 domain-containing protein Os10g0323000-like [Oryza glaberrima]XP_052139862.1 B3 domain-containing protein Os10g0323000-like [Oryza glaberrima]XP_052139863.1 B3 domain-containing protein Os10g0323000-like [Oryza glaberrima]XP_052139864.1 B3 domain-containing protein Os10g0323000-like [Oryza glaberrima]XP_052139865.1 B3 domain-cont